MVTGYVPDRGDLIWLDFDPQAGREQAKRRPVLVLSPVKYNRLAGMALVCPVTSRVRGRRFEVELPGGLDATGVVISDQVRSLDWRERRARYIGKAERDVIEAVVQRVIALLTE